MPEFTDNLPRSLGIIPKPYTDKDEDEYPGLTGRTRKEKRSRDSSEDSIDVEFEKIYQYFMETQDSSMLGFYTPDGSVGVFSLHQMLKAFVRGLEVHRDFGTTPTEREFLLECAGDFEFLGKEIKAIRNKVKKF